MAEWKKIGFTDKERTPKEKSFQQSKVINIKRHSLFVLSLIFGKLNKGEPSKIERETKVNRTTVIAYVIDVFPYPKADVPPSSFSLSKNKPLKFH